MGDMESDGSCYSDTTSLSEYHNAASSICDVQKRQSSSVKPGQVDILSKLEADDSSTYASFSDNSTSHCTSLSSRYVSIESRYTDVYDDSLNAICNNPDFSRHLSKQVSVNTKRYQERQMLMPSILYDSLEDVNSLVSHAERFNVSDSFVADKQLSSDSLQNEVDQNLSVEDLQFDDDSLAILECDKALCDSLEEFELLKCIVGEGAEVTVEEIPAETASVRNLFETTEDVPVNLFAVTKTMESEASSFQNDGKTMDHSVKNVDDCVKVILKCENSSIETNSDCLKTEVKTKESVIDDNDDYFMPATKSENSSTESKDKCSKLTECNLSVDSLGKNSKKAQKKKDNLIKSVMAPGPRTTALQRALMEAEKYLQTNEGSYQSLRSRRYVNYCERTDPVEKPKRRNKGKTKSKLLCDTKNSDLSEDSQSSDKLSTNSKLDSHFESAETHVSMNKDTDIDSLITSASHHSQTKSIASDSSEFGLNPLQRDVNTINVEAEISTFDNQTNISYSEQALLDKTENKASDEGHEILPSFCDENSSVPTNSLNDNSVSAPKNIDNIGKTNCYISTGDVICREIISESQISSAFDILHNCSPSLTKRNNCITANLSTDSSFQMSDNQQSDQTEYSLVSDQIFPVVNSDETNMYTSPPHCQPSNCIPIDSSKSELILVQDNLNDEKSQINSLGKKINCEANISVDEEKIIGDEEECLNGSDNKTQQNISMTSIELNCESIPIASCAIDKKEGNQDIIFNDKSRAPSRYNKSVSGRRSEGGSPIILKHNKPNLQEYTDPLFDALDLQDISICFTKDKSVRYRSSAIPLNLCLRDMNDYKENIPVSSVCPKPGMANSPIILKSKVPVLENKTPVKSASCDDFKKPSTLTKIPIRKKKAVDVNSADKDNCKILPASNPHSPVATPVNSADKGHRFCSVRNSVYCTRLPQHFKSLTSKRFQNIKSPVAQYIRSETACSPLQSSPRFEKNLLAHSKGLKDREKD